MIQLTWNGFYLDGKTAQKKAATVELSVDSLKIRVAPGEELVWSLDEVRQVQGYYGREPVQLVRGNKETPEILIIDDPAFLLHLHKLSPGKTGHLHNPARRSIRARLTVSAAVGILVLGASIYLWGIPFIAGIITPLIPVAWEKGLGQSVLEILAPEDTQCRDPELNDALARITSILTAHETRRYTFKIYVIESEQVNAIALPGGSIILFSGLIQQSGSPEEIAGVIAHEIQHITRRHATKRIIEQSSTGFMISAVTGDMTGAMVYTVKIADTLAHLRYSRQDEDEADREGMKMILAAGIDPSGMIRLYEKIGDRGTLPGFLRYVSTHPDMDQRVQRLRKLAVRDGPRRYRNLPAKDSWDRIKHRCR